MTIHDLVLLQRRAFLSGPLLSVNERLDMLDGLREAILNRENAIYAALEQDLGKCAGEAYMTEIGMVLSEIRFAMHHLRRWAASKRVHMPLAHFPSSGWILREPYGVTLIMSPWNYPFQLTLSPFVGALAAGNHCIIKPSAYSPATGQLIADLIADCFPMERAAVILGGREENRALLDERFDYIFFTGSKAVGQVVLQKAARYVTPVTLELGGKSPCIVDDSADIRLAARRIAFGKGLNAGQTCVAPDYLLVHEKVRNQLMQEISQCWQDFYGSDPLASPQWPRMVSRKHYDRVMDLMIGEQVYCGGVGDGIRIAPTLLYGVTWDSPIMQEEIFGPVLPVMTFREIDEVIQQVNSHEPPLALYLFTRRSAVEDVILNGIPFGGGCVNDTVIHLANPRLPFGGIGASGMGHYHGKYSFDTFTHEKTIVKKGFCLDLPVRYAPYTRGKWNLIRKIMR